MISKFEKREYVGGERVWVGKYRNLHNISHWHLEHEIIACRSGHAQIMLNDNLFSIKEGECLFCQSGSTHYIDADENCTLIVCLFDEKMGHPITLGAALESPLFTDMYGITDKLLLSHRELSEQSLFYEKKTEAIISEALVDIFRNLPLARSNPSEKIMTRYKKLLSKIDTEYEFITFRDGADFMHLSESYFSKYFKHRAGMTFSQYVNVVRIEKAVEILTNEPEAKAADVMLRCGFATIRNFNRAFKDITGFTPKTIPDGYTLNTRSVPSDIDTFDPTSGDAVLLP